MIVITKLSEDSYAISDGKKLQAPVSRSEVLATCHWEYKLDISFVDAAMRFTKARGEEMTIINGNQDFTTKKIDYTEMGKQ